MVKFDSALNLLIFVVAGTLACYPQYDGGLTYFLTDKLQEYNGWLKQKNLDPTGIVFDGPILLQSSLNGSVVISALLSNIFLSDFSNTSDPACGYGHLGSTYFTVDRNTTLTYEGDYSLAGSIRNGNTSIHFSGHGKFKLPQQHPHFVWSRNIESLVVQRFEEANGHWNITVPGTIYMYFIGTKCNPDKVEFDGLLSDDDISLFMPEIKRQIAVEFDKFTDANQRQTDHILRRHMTTYLQEQFEKTSLEEIENWPRPNSTKSK